MEKNHTLFRTNEKKYYLAWSRIGKLGNTILTQLKKDFGTLERAWKAQEQEFTQAGYSDRFVQAIRVKRNTITAEELEQELIERKITAVCIDEPDYPELLRQSPAPPIVVYLRGQLPSLPCLAVVGTRNISRYGQIVAEKVVAELSQAGLAIISGLALGVDAVAHAATLQKQGQTVAVFGSGLDQVFPRTNYKLAERILEQGGAWVSEFPIGTPARPQHFPQRNRIIAGLSLGCLVIEAGERSGALITARFALEANREVFAVPGPIFQPQSIGPNMLIQQGATLCTKAEDILTVLDVSPKKNVIKQSMRKLSLEEGTILQHLSIRPLHLDQLIERSQLPSHRVLTLCAQLEIQGLIRSNGDSNYSLLR